MIALAFSAVIADSQDHRDSFRNIASDLSSAPEGHRSCLRFVIDGSSPANESIPNLRHRLKTGLRQRSIRFPCSCCHLICKRKHDRLRRSLTFLTKEHHKKQQGQCLIKSDHFEQRCLLGDEQGIASQTYTVWVPLSSDCS
jgi:hypothetical protein